MSKSRQEALARTLRNVLSEAELKDLRVLIDAADRWADELINRVAPESERLHEFDRAYSQRDEALDIGNALNRFDAV